MKAEGRVLVHPSLEANSSKKDSASKEVNSVCLFESCGFFSELKLLKLWKRTIAFKARLPFQLDGIHLLQCSRPRFNDPLVIAGQGTIGKDWHGRAGVFANYLHRLLQSFKIARN